MDGDSPPVFHRVHLRVVRPCELFKPHWRQPHAAFPLSRFRLGPPAGPCQYIVNPPSYRRASRWTARDKALAPSSAWRTVLSQPPLQGRERDSRPPCPAAFVHLSPPGRRVSLRPTRSKIAPASLPLLSPGSGVFSSPMRGPAAAEFLSARLPLVVPAASSASAAKSAAVSHSTSRPRCPPEGPRSSAAPPVPTRDVLRISSEAYRWGSSEPLVSALRLSRAGTSASAYRSPSRALTGVSGMPFSPPKRSSAASRTIPQNPEVPTGGPSASPRPAAYRPDSPEPRFCAFSRSSGLRRVPPVGSSPPQPEDSSQAEWSSPKVFSGFPLPSSASSASCCRSSSQPK